MCGEKRVSGGALVGGVLIQDNWRKVCDRRCVVGGMLHKVCASRYVTER